MKKRLLGLLLCTAMVMSLTIGCGSTSDEKETNTEKETTKEDGAKDEPVEAEAVDQRTVYVSPEWVKSVIDGNQEGYENYIIGEVSYGDVDASPDYKEGHLPGAIHLDNCEVEDATGSEEGAYNLLPAEEVEKYLLSHGITKDTKVILYGQDVSGVGRQAYGYLWAGVEDVKILNGGIDAWKKAGYDLETKVNKGKAVEEFGTAVPAHPEYWVSIEDAKDRLANDDNFKLVSIRSEDEWLGKTSGYNYMDKAGEPEGAVWGKGARTAFDVADFTNDNGTVKDIEGFKEVWKDCDFTLENDLAFYCGTGWRATVPFLVLYQEGYDNVAVYDGGWYEWLMHDDYPVQVGDPASDDCEHTTVGELPTGKAAK